MKRTPLEAWAAAKMGLAGAPLTRAGVEGYQLSRLQATLDLAREKSQFYRKHLVGSLPDLRCLDDLGQLPFTTADDLRRNPLAFLCVSQDDVHRVVTLDTSGTSGPPKRIYFTADDQETTIDFFRAGMSTFTEPGDRVLILLPGQTPGSVGDLLATALARLGATGVKHGPVREAGLALAAIRSEGIAVIVGVPTHVLALVRHPDGPETGRSRIRSVLLTADHVPEAIKQAVESAWGCAVYNHYGMTEMGLGGAVECEARDGYHLREADLFVEIVQPETGQPVAEGTLGEIVFTTLTRRGMPLIRYRTGDLGRFISGPCPCGTALKRLSRVTTRLGGRVALGDGHLTMAELDEAIFPVEGVLNFAATLGCEAGRERLGIEVKPADSLTEDRGKLASAIASIRKAVEGILAVRAAQAHGCLEVAVTAVDAIPATMAKRAISDLRGGP